MIGNKRKQLLLIEREYFNITVSNSAEFRGFTRHCLPESALNGGYCKTENETEAVWVKWVDDLATFEESVQICENLGGILFPDLAGDGKQIDFLKRFSSKNVWLGLTSGTKWNDWKNLRGEKLTPNRIPWLEFEEVAGYAQVAGRIKTHLPKVQMSPPQLERKTVCQMLT